MERSLVEGIEGVNKGMPAKKTVPVEDLKPDTYYDAPLWLDESYLLLPKDAPVTAALKTNLQAWGVKSIETAGDPVLNKGNSGTPEVLSGAILNNDAKEMEGRRNARAFFTDLATFTRRVFDTFTRDGNLDIDAITEKVKEIIQMLKDNRSYMLRLQDLRADGVDYLYTHSARTTIISLSIGEGLKLPNFRLIELGITSMLHEIGMMRIPRQVYDKSTSLTDAEKKFIATHPTLGLRMLQDYSKENANPLAQDILMGVWQHHERSNGTGYPQGLQGDAISLFGKIIGAACSYDAQISKRPHRNRMDGYTSMLIMLKEMRSLYDERVISALLNSISIYPLGSYVRLKNGSIGVVVDTGDDNPKFPMVKLHLDDALHAYKEQPVVKTADNEELAVVGVLNEQETTLLIQKGLLPK